MNKENEKGNETEQKSPIFYVCSLSNTEELVEMVIESFIYADQLASHLEIDEIKFRELYYEEVKRDIIRGIEKGLCGYIKIDGEMAAFASLIDVADIHIGPIQNVVTDKLESYERVMNSFYTIIKDSHPRNEALYFQYIVTKNKFANYMLASNLVNAGGRLAMERGCKYFYAIPINKIAESFEKKWPHSLIAEINLDSIKFGEDYPFEGIDYKIPLLMFTFENLKDKFIYSQAFHKPSL